MARVPMGKVLLRNVIRHTGAHNKIQEESEMWKMRDKEKQWSCQTSTMHMNRGHMHCDRLEGSTDRVGSQERSLSSDDREARYWTRKLYEFEAKDPDRWGHSGFKELYPEEFQIEGKYGDDGRNKHRKKRKTKDAYTAKTKHSKKSSKKKKKKKEEKKRKRAGGSGEESDSLRGRRRSRSEHGRKKRGRRKEEESTSDEEEEGGSGERRRQKGNYGGAESSLEPPQKKKRRKNWKEANEESEGSSDD